MRQAPVTRQVRAPRDDGGRIRRVRGVREPRANVRDARAGADRGPDAPSDAPDCGAEAPAGSEETRARSSRAAVTSANAHDNVVVEQVPLPNVATYETAPATESQARVTGWPVTDTPAAPPARRMRSPRPSPMVTGPPNTWLPVVVTSASSVARPSDVSRLARQSIAATRPRALQAAHPVE